MNNLSDLKVGDKCFGIRYGNGSIAKISPTDNGHHSIAVKISSGSTISFSLTGRYSLYDDHPTLFRSAQEASEYFKQVHEESFLVDADEAIKAFRAGKEVSSSKLELGIFVLDSGFDEDCSDFAFKILSDRSGKKQWKIHD